MLNVVNRSCMVLLLSMTVWLCGCIEVDQHIRVLEDGSMSYRGTLKIDPQYEALVLPQLRAELPKKAPPGVRFDFTQRIDGKAAVLIEADGAAAASMLNADDSSLATATVSAGGFMKKRYQYRKVVKRASEFPIPIRTLVSLPGSIETVTGGTKTADDTVEFNQTHAKRGDVFAVTSTAFAFNLRGGGGGAAAAVPDFGTARWLLPASIGAIGVGLVLLLIGWLRLRQPARSASSPPIVPVPMPSPSPSPSVPPPVAAVASVFCTECGVPNAAGRKFCGKCGHALG